MKKLISVLLALSMVVSLSACGKNGPSTAQDGTEETAKPDKLSKQEMQDAAQELDLVNMSKDVSENEARANAMYLGNIYRVDGYITEIKADYCIVSMKNSYSVTTADNVYRSYELHIYFQDDSLTTLNKFEKITVVGDITNMDSNLYAVMENAFYIDNIYTITGTIIGSVRSVYAEFVYAIETNDNDSPIGIWLERNSVSNALKDGDVITVTGKLTTSQVQISSDPLIVTNSQMKDAELLETKAE